MATEVLSTAPPAYTETVENEEQKVEPLPQTSYTYPAVPTTQGGPATGMVPMQYMLVPTSGVQVQKPPYPAPHTFFIVTLITTIVCGFLNILSLMFGIPAIVLVYMSVTSANNGNYTKAKKYRNYALVLVIVNVVLTLSVTMLIIALLETVYNSRVECNTLYSTIRNYEKEWYCY